METSDLILSSDQEAAVSTSDAKKHFVANTVSNLVFFVATVVGSFFMVPYQKNHLGIANYGTVTTAHSFTLYTQVLTVVLTTTLFRFATMHLARGDTDEARKYFNTQLVAVVWFVAAFAPLSLIISYYTPSIIRIPGGEDWNTRILFAAMYLSFLVNLVCNPLRIAQFARHRFDLGNWANLAGQVARYATWIVLFGVLAPLTWHIGLGFLLESIVVLIASAVIFRRLLPNLRPSLRGFDKRKFIDMTKMGAWLAANHVGVVLYLSVDLFLINRLLGPASAGSYALILGIAMMLRTLSSTMSSLITPLAVSYYACGDYKSMTRQMARAVRFVSLGMAIPLATVCGIAAPFLAWWLGPECRALYPLVWWLLAHQVITCAVEPLYSINMAANRMSVPALVTVAGGVLKVVLSVALVKFTPLGIYGVAIGGFCAFVLKNTLFTPWYAAHTINVRSWPFYKAMVPSVVVFGVISLTALELTHHVSLHGFAQIAATVASVFLVSVVGTYYLAITEDDREFLRSAAPWNKKRARTP